MSEDRTKIVVSNDTSYVVDPIPGLHQKLWKALRKRPRDYFFNPLYRQKKWDGWIDFYGKTTGRFMTGLLPEVTGALEVWGVPYEITDTRKPFAFTRTEIGPDFFNQFLPASGKWPNGKPAKPVTPYDYQLDLTSLCLKLHRGIVKAPTGAGKSLMMTGLFHCLPPNTPALFLTKQTTLVAQTYNDLVKWGVPNVGILGGGEKKPNVITVSTLDSVHRIERLFPYIRVLVVDECHLMMTKKAKAVYRALKNANVRLAFSATPFKFGGTDPVQKFLLKGFFGPVLLTETTEDGTITTDELKERGILSKSKCVFYNIREPQLPYELYNDAVLNGVANSHHFHQVVRSLVKTLKGRTMIMVERIPHGDNLQKAIPGALWVRGKDTPKTRQWVIDQLTDRDDDVVAICTQKIMNAGVNVFVHNLINAAGGKADHDIIQRMGRGLRTADDKEILNYYDFMLRINPYLESHSEKRVDILKDEGHDVEVRDPDFPIS